MRHDPTWMALAVGALEPGDAAALLRSAGASAPLRLATLRLLAGLDPGPVLPRLDATLGAAPLLDGVAPPAEGPLPVGSRVRLRLQPPAPAATLRPVILRQAAGRTTRLLPAPRGVWPVLDRFLAEDEARVVDLVLGPPAGRQRLVVALLSAADTAGGWVDTPGLEDRLVAQVAAGTLPGALLEVEVG